MSRQTVTRNNDFIDIELPASLFNQQSTLSEKLYARDIKQRRLFLEDLIAPETVDEIAAHILQYNKEDKGIKPEERTPVLLYLNSNGGDVMSGLKLIDVIENSKTPVYTINLGWWYSMGFLIGIAGHKRYASKHATFLMHDGTICLGNSGGKFQDQIKFNTALEERIKQHVLSKTNITSEEYDTNSRVEWYLFAEEAKEKGVIDFIIGEDCDIDDIV